MTLFSKTVCTGMNDVTEKGNVKTVIVYRCLGFAVYTKTLLMVPGEEYYYPSF